MQSAAHKGTVWAKGKWKCGAQWKENVAPLYLPHACLIKSLSS